MTEGQRLTTLARDEQARVTAALAGLVALLGRWLASSTTACLLPRCAAASTSSCGRCAASRQVALRP